jgi:hypothetical protein
VHFNDQFWAPRIEINRTRQSLLLSKHEETGRVYLERAAAALKGKRRIKPPDIPSMTLMSTR